MTSARDPGPSKARGAYATFAQLKIMGQSWSEPEPDVVVVVRWTGELMRWLRVSGSDSYRLVSEAT